MLPVVGNTATVTDHRYRLTSRTFRRTDFHSRRERIPRFKLERRILEEEEALEYLVHGSALFRSVRKDDFLDEYRRRGPRLLPSLQLNFR